jgi:hypothetical protein
LTDAAGWARLGFWAALVVGWVVMVGLMWDALTMIPSAERLEASRMAVIPTPRTFFTAMTFSALELALVLAVLWPWWTGYYATRLGVTALALSTWFVMTIPMGLNRMDWIHRRWLAAMALATAAALIVTLGYRLIRRAVAREG